MSRTVYSRMAHAKINLALHVMGQCDDGLHLLDSLVCFASMGDYVKISPFPDSSRLITLRTTGPFACDLCASEDNLVVRAACTLATKLNNDNIACSPVRISLVKNLPVASGIGGGSSNAAVTFALLTKFWLDQKKMDSHRVNLYKIAKELGADIPMCLDYYPKRAQGIGEKLSPLRLFCSLPLLLVNPGVALPTSDVFRSLGEKFCPSIDMESMRNITSIDRMVATLSPLQNNLQAPAIRFVPAIHDVLSQINRQPGCQLARMSGSGATCFGIFDSRQSVKRAMVRVREKNPDWWVAACDSIPQKESG